MCLHFGYNVLSNENTIKIVFPTMTQLRFALHDKETSNGERLANDDSKLHLHYFLKVIVSVTFMTSLIWYSGGPIFRWAWGCSSISRHLSLALVAMPETRQIVQPNNLMSQI